MEKEIYKKNTNVKFSRKRGRVVRYDDGKPYQSPFYVIYTGEYESHKVPAYQVEKDEDFRMIKTSKSSPRKYKRS